ncbi:hypothetical protein DET49_11160 [Salegentibacter sp. 24]|nr:hypothetical protein DET49_11160 [Salegentibacter sp. 24]
MTVSKVEDRQAPHKGKNPLFHPLLFLTKDFFRINELIQFQQGIQKHPGSFSTCKTELVESGRGRCKIIIP